MKMLKMQQPTSKAIQEQVSVEVGEQLPNRVVESALNKTSKKKKKKWKGLAQINTDSKKRVNAQSSADQETSLEKTFEGSGMNRLGEVGETTAIIPQTTIIPGVASQVIVPQQNATILPNNTRGNSTGRGRFEAFLSDRPVRMIHMKCTCLLHCWISTKIQVLS